MERAALELYLERGYDHTTVAEIAQRAGLTERTFFRHFADKREVLFRGEVLARAIVAVLKDVPPSVAPLDAVGTALESQSEFFDQRRPYSKNRQAVIDANPALQERELIKLDSMATMIAAAMRDRGVTESAATLTAQAGVAVFKVAFQRWSDDPSNQVLAVHIRATLAELKAVAQA